MCFVRHDFVIKFSENLSFLIAGGSVTLSSVVDLFSKVTLGASQRQSDLLTVFNGASQYDINMLFPGVNYGK